jgi:hypothetical protein
MSGVGLVRLALSLASVVLAMLGIVWIARGRMAQRDGCYFIARDLYTRSAKFSVAAALLAFASLAIGLVA